MQNHMKITLEFPGATVEEAMANVRAFAEAWVNVYANAALPADPVLDRVAPLVTPTDVHPPRSFLEEVTALEERGVPLPVAEQAGVEVLEAERRAAPTQNAFLDEVITALEERERDFDKPAKQGPSPTRDDVNAEFRAMIKEYTVGKDQTAATAAGKAVLSKLSATSVPGIAEDKFADAITLLKHRKGRTPTEFVEFLS